MSVDRDLLRRMEEAALLPPADEERLRVEDEVRAAGPSTQAVWDDLLSETEVLAAQLPAVQVPVGLELRLAALSDPVAEVSHRRRLPTAWLAAAAAVLLALALVVADQYVRGGSGHMERVAQRVAENYLQDAHISVETSSHRELDLRLSAKLPFQVRTPAAGPQATLLGGRSCKLGDQAVAFSAWSGAAGEYGLYQYPRTGSTYAPELRVVWCGPDRVPIWVRTWADDAYINALVSRVDTRFSDWPTHD